MKKLLAMMLITALVMSVCSFSFGTVYAADWTVTLNNFDGEGGVSTYDIDNNKTLPASEYPTREGWYFAGWYKDAELTNLWWDSDKVTADTELFAKWVQLPGTVVTDNLNRDTNITYSGGGNYASRVRNWFAPGFSYTHIQNDKVLINSDVVITIDLNNAHNLYGAVLNTTDSQVGSYRFSGSKNGKDWTVMTEVTADTRKVSDCAFPADSHYRFIKLETLGDHKTGWWAHHKIAILGESNPIHFNVSFVSEGNTVYTEENVLENTAIAGPSSDPVHSEGKVFAGWYYEETFENEWNPSDLMVEGCTLYAKWFEDLAVVSFDSCGGSAVNSIDVEKNTLATAPANPTKDGGVFCGWYKDAEYTQVFDFATEVITGDITLFAKWADASFSISRNNGIASVGPITTFDNRSNRIWQWFYKIDSSDDKSVVSHDIINSPIEIKITLTDPYVITAVKTRLMPSMYNVDYTLYGTNTEDLEWNAEGWDTILAVTANGEAQRGFGIENETAYKYLKLSVHSKKDAWVGMYGMEFFGHVAAVEETTATISSVAEGTVSYEVTLAQVDADAVVLVALYSGDDLVAVKKVNAADTSCAFENAAGADKAKIFVWEDLVTIKPITMDELSF